MSGVSGANVRAEQATDKDHVEASSSHRQSHRDFPYSDPALFEPSRTFNHVLDAVSYVVEKERLH